MPEPIRTLDVAAKSWWTDTGIDVRRGETLRFAADGIWWDASYEAGPDGRDIASVRRLRFLRRVPDADWVALAGVVGRFGTPFRIGAGAAIPFAREGRLYLFANDVFGFYHNNKGSVSVRIYRE